MGGKIGDKEKIVVKVSCVSADRIYERRKNMEQRDRCPYCGKNHIKYPLDCAQNVRIRHSILCGVSTMHQGGCFWNKMKEYVDKFNVKVFLSYADKIHKGGEINEPTS